MIFSQPLVSGQSTKAGVFFAILVLFVPTSSFYVYYAAVVFGVMILVWSSRGEFPWRISSFYLYVTIIALLLSLCLLRWVYFASAEDFKELLKLIVFCSVLFFGVRLDIATLEKIFAIFVVANCTVALLQYLGIYEFGVREITDIYNAQHHVEASLSYSIPRALGLSPGPGQQSVICLFLFSFFMVKFFFGGGGVGRLFLCIFSLLGMVLSQSKTALIAIALGSGAVLLLFILHASYRVKLGVLLFFVLAVGSVFLFKDQLLILFPEYFRLAEQGGDVSSLQSRLNNWTQMLEVFALENSLVWYLFGVGRSGLDNYGVNDLPYDSDYVYVLANYGVLGLLAFVLFIAFFLLRGFIGFSREGLYGKVLTVSLVYAVISALALNYFLESRISLLFAILIFNCLAPARVSMAKISDR